MQLDIIESSEEILCEGIVWRGRVSSWCSDGVIQSKKSISILKRKSCKGCVHCEWLQDFLKEDIGMNEKEDVLSNIEDGKLYMVFFNFIKDYESGYEEIDGWELKEVPDGKEAE